MVNNSVLFVFLFWGVWLIIPLLVDGGSTLWNLWLAVRLRRRPEPPPLPDSGLPTVSVIIPAHNEEDSIAHCLLALRAQTYPHHLIEIIVVDDGSQDSTAQIVLEHMGTSPAGYLHTFNLTYVPREFGGVINLVRRKRDDQTAQGKSAAVNAGLTIAKGEIIVAIDSDIVLEPDAIEQAVRALLADEKLVAATGHLIIDPFLVLAHDEAGNVKLDSRGIPVARSLSFSERVLTACQFLEYVTAFHLGRRSESLMDSMFTLSGACAVYRRDAFEANRKYRGRTVSEDADLTMALHELSESRVGYLPNMRAHLRPVLTWSRLYSQRTRWQRGALEASAVHLMLRRRWRTKWLFWKIALPLRLQIDHTLALPRLLWTFLIWMLPLFGYSWIILVQAMALMLVLYLIINTLRTLVTYAFSSTSEKVFIRQYLSYLPVWPVYNTFLFWVRMGAELRALTEMATWTVQIPWLEKLESLKLRRTVAHAATFLLARFIQIGRF